MFGVVNSKTNEFVVELGSRIVEEQRPHIRIWMQSEHAEEFIKYNLLNCQDYEVVPMVLKF